MSGQGTRPAIFFRELAIQPLPLVKAFAMKYPAVMVMLIVTAMTAVGVLGCAAGPQTVFDALLQVDSSRISYSFEEAITAASPIQIVKNIAQEISLEESDPVFDAGWTISYYKSLRFEGAPGKHYCCTIWSLCHCFGFTKTLVLPYGYVVNAIGDSLAEGPGELIAMAPTIRLPIHLKGSFDFTAGESGTCYFLVLGDNRDPGTPSASWDNRYTATDGTEYIVQGDVVASPVGAITVLIEDLK